MQETLDGASPEHVARFEQILRDELVPLVERIDMEFLRGASANDIVSVSMVSEGYSIGLDAESCSLRSCLFPAYYESTKRAALMTHSYNRDYARQFRKFVRTVGHAQIDIAERSAAYLRRMKSMSSARSKIAKMPLSALGDQLVEDWLSVIYQSDRSEFLTELAAVLWDQGHLEAALYCFQRASDLGSARARFSHANARLWLGQRNGSVETLRAFASGSGPYSASAAGILALDEIDRNVVAAGTRAALLRALEAASSRQRVPGDASAREYQNALKRIASEGLVT